MSSIVKELIKGQKFSLYKVKNRHTGKVHYKIKTDSWAWRSLDILMDEVRTHFDPGFNRGGRYAYAWKFSNREIAEKLLMMAILKWGS